MGEESDQLARNNKKNELEWTNIENQNETRTRVCYSDMNPSIITSTCACVNNEISAAGRLQTQKRDVANGSAPINKKKERE